MRTGWVLSFVLCALARTVLSFFKPGKTSDGHTYSGVSGRRISFVVSYQKLLSSPSALFLLFTRLWLRLLFSVRTVFAAQHSSLPHCSFRSSDISFWKNTTSVKGLSVRTIFLNAFCQVNSLFPIPPPIQSRAKSHAVLAIA